LWLLNGKLTYEQFAQRKCKFGIQKELLYGARVRPAFHHGANAIGKSEKMRHFRKLAQLVARIGKETRREVTERIPREQHSTTRASWTSHLEGKQDGIATLVMNRPDRLNALTTNWRWPSMMRSGESREIRRRGGHYHWSRAGVCAGGDLGAMAASRQKGAMHDLEPLLRAGCRWCSHAHDAQPVIAAVNGAAQAQA